jgi:hypothetical protein
VPIRQLALERRFNRERSFAEKNSGSKMSEEIRDQRKEATEYLEKHKLIKLFEILGSKLATEKPANANAFLLEEISKAQVMSQRGQPYTLFQEKDIEVMFRVFDITTRGYLDQEQYLKALNAVGIEAPALKTPIGDKIDKKTFVAYIMAEVLRCGF